MGLFVLLGVLVFAGIFVTTATVLAVVLRAVLWLVFLPFRLIFWAIALPILIVKFVFLAVVGVLTFGLVGILGGALAVAFVAAVLTPLLPLALVALAIWAGIRLLRRPAAA